MQYGFSSKNKKLRSKSAVLTIYSNGPNGSVDPKWIFVVNSKILVKNVPGSELNPVAAGTRRFSAGVRHVATEHDVDKFSSSHVHSSSIPR